MASLFTHVAVPLLARRAVRVPKELERRLDVIAVLVSIWPDLDYATLPFEVRPNDLLGHRGLTHSLFVAIAVGLVASLLFPKSARRRIAPLLVLVALSHPIIDAMTAGDLGVALFWPITRARFSFPFSLVATCPVGLDEWLGYWGLLTIANEALYIVMPLALAVAYARSPERRARIAMYAGAWIVGLVVLRLTMPLDFRSTAARAIHAGDMSEIPPDGKLVTKLDELRERGLLDATLEPKERTWSSTFFPTWFGGDAGRWMDGTPALAWRTLVGFHAPKESDARDLAARSAKGDPDAIQRIFRLSPTEKIDIAFGHYDFPVTDQALSMTHNRRPRPRYWSGRCNGVASASIAVPEPFRDVEVIGVDGARVRFHPNDVKSLLAVAYDDSQSKAIVGGVCTTIAFDAGAACSMDPAVLLVVTANRIGIAHTSFLVDALPTIAKQYYAVASARLHVGEPRDPGNTAIDPSVRARVARVADATIDLVLSSTTLPLSAGNVQDPENNDPTVYKRVGLVPVPMHYTATIAIDAAGELVGGMWTGHPADGPDDVLIATGGPALRGEMLSEADRIPWSFVERLAQASVQEGAMPTIDLRK
jgi:inner membrane protein